MRYILVILLASLSLFSQNQEYIKKGINYVEVRGTAELIVPTDEASFSFTMEATGSSLKKAVSNAKEKVQVILEDLKKLGVKEKDIETSRFFSSENFGDKSFFSSKNDFKSTITATVTFTDLAVLEQAIFLISENRPKYLSDIRFNLRAIEKHKDDALKDAVDAAYIKAQKLADASKGKVSRLLYSTIEDFNARPYMMETMNVNTRRTKLSMDDTEMAPTIHAQNRTIRVTVRAIYQID